MYPFVSQLEMQTPVIESPRSETESLHVTPSEQELDNMFISTLEALQIEGKKQMVQL
jgi:hypothetical protein